MNAAFGRRPWLRDALVALGLVALAAVVGYRHLAANYQCQNCIPELLYPCLRDFGRMPEVSELAKVPAYQEFWAKKLDTIPCDAVRGLPTIANGQAWELQRYLHRLQSLVMLLTGPRFAGYHYFQAAMYALTSLAAYALFRLAMGRVVAAAMTVALILSPLHLWAVLTPADYAKAPFALGTLWAIGLLVRRSLTRRTLIALSLLCGAIVGLGIGFKPDVIVSGVVAVATLALFLPPLVDGGRWRRLTAVTVFLAGVLGAGGPVLATNFFNTRGSLLPVQVFGGMDRSFDDFHAAPSLYDYGIVFDDTYVSLQINSFNERVYQAPRFVNFFEREMTEAGTRIVLATERLVPADRILRVLGAILRVLALAPFGWAAAAVALAVLYATNLRLGLCVTFLLLTSVGYVSLVFVPRHYFHTQFAPLWFTGFLIHHSVMAMSARRSGAGPALAAVFARPGVTRGLAAFAAAVILLSAVLAGARVYQQHRMTALAEAYNRDENLETLQTSRADLDGGRARLDVVGGLAHGSTDNPERPVVAANYLVAEVECLAPIDGVVVTSYRQPEYWQQATTVRCSQRAGRWRLFLPTYDLAERVRVQGVEWASGDSVRVVSLRKVRDLAKTPLLIKLALPEDWSQRPMYHQFSLDALRRKQF